MTFLELAQLILKEEKKPLTAIEIWNHAVEKGYDKKLNSQGKNFMVYIWSSNLCE